MTKKLNIISLVIFTILYIITSLFFNILGIDTFASNPIYLNISPGYIIGYVGPVLLLILIGLYIYAKKNKERFFELKSFEKVLNFISCSYFVFILIDVLYTVLFAAKIFDFTYYGGNNLIVFISRLFHFIPTVNIYYTISFILLIVWLLILKKKKIKVGAK